MTRIQTPTFATLFLWFCIAIFSFPNSCQAETILVIEVIDGDTLLMNIDGTQSYVALYGIDAPETGQPYSGDAKKFIENVMATSSYTVKMTKTENTTHRSCEINYLNSSGSNLNLACMLAINGLAFYDKRLDSKQPDVTKFMSSEKLAKDRKVGVWSQSDIVYPWDYRKQNNIVEHEVMDMKEKTHRIFSNVRGGNAEGIENPGLTTDSTKDINTINLEKRRLQEKLASLQDRCSSASKAGYPGKVSCQSGQEHIRRQIEQLEKDSEYYFYKKDELDRNKATHGTVIDPSSGRVIGIY